MRPNFKPVFAVVLAQFLAPLAMSQTTEPVRKYGVGLDFDALRNWNDNGNTVDRLATRGSVLFLNHNFHFGPSVSWERFYDRSYGDREWSVGVLGKWTYEDLQTTDRTPFITVGGSLSGGKGDHNTSSGTGVSVGLGYETFLNPYISLAPSIEYFKNTRKSTWDSPDQTLRNHSSTTGTDLHLAFNLYL